MLLANLEANRNPGRSWPQNLRQVELQKSETAFVSFFFRFFCAGSHPQKHGQSWCAEKDHPGEVVKDAFNSEGGETARRVAAVDLRMQEV